MTEDEFTALAERAWQAAIANAAMAGESVTEDDDAVEECDAREKLEAAIKFFEEMTA